MILSEQIAEEVAELLRTFSIVTRLRILSALAEREYNVTQLSAAVGISASGIFHYMCGLRQMQMVQILREGKEVYDRVENEHILALFQQGNTHVQNG